MLSSVGRTWGQDMATGAQNRPGIGEDTALGVALALRDQDIPAMVADAVAACLLDTDGARRTVGRTYECAGPDVLTLADLVRIAGRYGSRQRPVLPLPAALGQLQARVMELMPGEPLMSRDNLAAMSVDNVATRQWPDLSALGIVPTSVHTVAPTYLGQRGGRSQLLDYRHEAGR